MNLQAGLRRLRPHPLAVVLRPHQQVDRSQPFVERRQLLPPEQGRLFRTDIRSWVVLLARMVGWRQSKRQPLPGNEVLWRAYVRLQTMVLGMQTLRGP